MTNPTTVLSNLPPMQQAFQASYNRDWNDPAGDDMKLIWAKAWEASQKVAASSLKTHAAKLRDMPIKGRIGDWHDAQTDAAAFDASAQFILSNN